MKMTPSSHSVDSKKIYVLVNVVVIFCAIEMVIYGLQTGCANVENPFQRPNVDSFFSPLIYIATIFYIPLLFATSFVGLLLLRYHASASAWLIHKAGRPRWNRRFFHPLILITFMAYWTLKQVGVLIFICSLYFQHCFIYPGTSFELFSMGSGMVLRVVLFLTLPILLIRFAVFITRRINRFIG